MRGKIIRCVSGDSGGFNHIQVPRNNLCTTLQRCCCQHLALRPGKVLQQQWNDVVCAKKSFCVCYQSGGSQLPQITSFVYSWKNWVIVCLREKVCVRAASCLDFVGFSHCKNIFFLFTGEKLCEKWAKCGGASDFFFHWKKNHSFVCTSVNLLTLRIISVAPVFGVCVAAQRVKNRWVYMVTTSWKAPPFLNFSVLLQKKINKHELFDCGTPIKFICFICCTKVAPRITPIIFPNEPPAPPVATWNDKKVFFCVWIPGRLIGQQVSLFWVYNIPKSSSW